MSSGEGGPTSAPAGHGVALVVLPHWDDVGSFKIVNVADGTWNESLRKALLEP